MVKINKYRIYCETESVYEYVWAEEGNEPTKCPVDSDHTVNPDSISIYKSIEESVVKIKEKNPLIGYQETKEHFTEETLSITCDPNATTSKAFSWPMPIEVMMASTFPKAIHDGDLISCHWGPVTGDIVGIITADVSSGETIIPVSSTVTDNMDAGYWMYLDDGTNKDTLGRVISVDKNAGTVTVETATTNSFLSGSHVKFRLYMLKGVVLVENYLHRFGEVKIGSAYIPKNSTMTFEYVNKTNSEKTFLIHFEYLY